MSADIVAFDPLDPGQAALLDGWRAALEASARVEYGADHSTRSADSYRAMFADQHDERRLAWAAVVDDQVVGHLAMALPVNDNVHRVDFTIAVHPNHRRRGIGTALLKQVERVTRAEGRTTLGVESDVAVGHDDPAVGFAARHGFVAALRDLRNALPVLGGAEALDEARSEAQKHAEAYEALTSWDGIPDEWLADRAVLSQRMSTDTPLGQLDTTETAWDSERVRRVFELAARQERRMVETVARHRVTGQLVAFTTIAVAKESPDVGYQWDTLVLREHRGHRLGLLVKAVNLQALIAELPEVRRVLTWNAAENEPMLRVNRALGFAPVGRTTEWQKRISQ
jgi:GNAT superfamily N-acetyltransferase